MESPTEPIAANTNTDVGKNGNMDSNNGALIAACRDGEQDLVLKLLEAGVDINQPGERGLTPLMWSCRRGHEDLAVMLCEKGAYLHAKDDIGSTAMDYNMNMDLRMVLKSRQLEALLKDKSKVDSNNKNQNKPINASPSSGSVGVSARFQKAKAEQEEREKLRLQEQRYMVKTAMNLSSPQRIGDKVEWSKVVSASDAQHSERVATIKSKLAFVQTTGIVRRNIEKFEQLFLLNQASAEQLRSTVRAAYKKLKLRDKIQLPITDAGEDETVLVDLELGGTAIFGTEWFSEEAKTYLETQVKDTIGASNQLPLLGGIYSASGTAPPVGLVVVALRRYSGEPFVAITLQALNNVSAEEVLGHHRIAVFGIHLPTNVQLLDIVVNITGSIDPADTDTSTSMEQEEEEENQDIWLEVPSVNTTPTIVTSLAPLSPETTTPSAVAVSAVRGDKSPFLDEDTEPCDTSTMKPIVLPVDTEPDEETEMEKDLKGLDAKIEAEDQKVSTEVGTEVETPETDPELEVKGGTDLVFDLGSPKSGSDIDTDEAPWSPSPAISDENGVDVEPRFLSGWVRVAQTMRLGKRRFMVLWKNMLLTFREKPDTNQLQDVSLLPTIATYQLLLTPEARVYRKFPRIRRSRPLLCVETNEKKIHFTTDKESAEIWLEALDEICFKGLSMR